jgi:hypothetical protein
MNPIEWLIVGAAFDIFSRSWLGLRTETIMAAAQVIAQAGR